TPREQRPPPYNTQPQYQPRPQQHQPYNNQPQPQYQPQPQPVVEGSDAGQLPSFITGAQPQQPAQNFSQNGGGDNQAGDRFPRHRRRRHRGPRPDMNAPQDFQGDEG